MLMIVSAQNDTVSNFPSISPATQFPSFFPTSTPSQKTTTSNFPSFEPSHMPSDNPTAQPTVHPSSQPSFDEVSDSEGQYTQRLTLIEEEMSATQVFNFQKVIEFYTPLYGPLKSDEPPKRNVSDNDNFFVENVQPKVRTNCTVVNQTVVGQKQNGSNIEVDVSYIITWSSRYLEVDTYPAGWRDFVNDKSRNGTDDFVDKMVRFGGVPVREASEVIYVQITSSPTISLMPSGRPSEGPTSTPTLSPKPSTLPSSTPSASPSISFAPTYANYFNATMTYQQILVLKEDRELNSTDQEYFQTVVAGYTPLYGPLKELLFGPYQVRVNTTCNIVYQEKMNQKVGRNLQNEISPTPSPSEELSTFLGLEYSISWSSRYGSTESYTNDFLQFINSNLTQFQLDLQRSSLSIIEVVHPVSFSTRTVNPSSSPSLSVIPSSLPTWMPSIQPSRSPQPSLATLSVNSGTYRQIYLIAQGFIRFDDDERRLFQASIENYAISHGMKQMGRRAKYNTFVDSNCTIVYMTTNFTSQRLLPFSDDPNTRRRVQESVPVEIEYNVTWSSFHADVSPFVLSFVSFINDHVSNRLFNLVENMQQSGLNRILQADGVRFIGMAEFSPTSSPSLSLPPQSMTGGNGTSKPVGENGTIHPPAGDGDTTSRSNREELRMLNLLWIMLASLISMWWI